MTPGCIRVICSSMFLALAVITIEAGGWVVITVTDLRDHVVAGERVTLTYGVRQHGMRLLDGLIGWIEARAGTDVIRAAAAPTPESGHYSAALTLPYAAEWTVDIRSGFAGGLNSALITLRAIDRGQPVPALSELERGQRLFRAKGCITCHAHGAVAGRTTHAGPALTTKRYEPLYLKQFLARPAQNVPFEPPHWQMPDLKLHERDIASLVAFITAGTPASAQR